MMAMWRSVASAPKPTYGIFVEPHDDPGTDQDWRTAAGPRGSPRSDTDMARCELRGRWLGDGAGWFARAAERRDRDLLQRRHPGCRLCCPMVRRLSGREHRRRLPDPRG